MERRTILCVLTTLFVGVAAAMLTYFFFCNCRWPQTEMPDNRQARDWLAEIRQLAEDELNQAPPADIAQATSFAKAILALSKCALDEASFDPAKAGNRPHEEVLQSARRLAEQARAEPDKQKKYALWLQCAGELEAGH